jgi:ADP-ribose pyrophosphatase YjhB (NUDIX family)/ribosomal protein S27AE
MARRKADKPIHKSWKFCPCCGGAPVAANKNPFQCRDCGYTHHFGPCAAVGGIITDASDQVLLLIRGKDPGKGQFGIPGGFVDQNETAEAALKREVFEEVRLKVTRCEYLCSFPNEYHYSGVIVPVTDLFFCVEVKTFDGMQAQAEEIQDWHFCRPGRKELSNMAFQSNRLALTYFLKQRRN